MKMLIPLLTLHEQAAQNANREAARAILALSNAKAPKDTKALVKSGAVRVEDLTAQVSYTAGHARFAHEDLDAKHEGGGQAKFLERASDEVDVQQIMAKHLRKEIGGG